MANMKDYVAWRGDIGLTASPWNAVDALLMATLSYLDFHSVDNARGWTLEEAKRIDLSVLRNRAQDIIMKHRRWKIEFQGLSLEDM